MRILLFLLFVLAFFAAYIAYRIFDVPYQVEVLDHNIPAFTQAYFQHNHDFKESKSLPIVGAAAFDIDNDKQPELFVGGGYYQQDAIFKFQDGVFENITQSIGLIKDFGDTSYGAASIDVNRDGYSDLFIARDSGIYLYLNKEGYLHKTKLDITIPIHSIPVSITLGDINKDKYVDIFVSCYISRAKFERYGYFNKKNYGATSLLLLNNGDNSFRVANQSNGIDIQKNTLSAVFADLDKDRALDLAVAYETGHIGTFKNNGGGIFKKINNPSDRYYSYPMGIAVGDYDNNGLIDIFSANIGTTIPGFLARGDLKSNQILNRKWILLQNNGDFAFEDVSDLRKVANYEFGRGAVMADLNLDGLQDLVVETNFHDFPPHLIYKTPGKLLIQNEKGEFAPVQEKAKTLNHYFGSTPIIADFNDDGFLDLVHINVGGPSKAYFNNGGEYHYSKVILDDTPESIGAVVTLITGTGKTISDQFVVGEGLASDQSHQIIFGLGFETSIKQIKVEYISGKKVTLDNPSINKTIYVSQSHAPSPDFDESNDANNTADTINDDEWSEPDVKDASTLESN